MRRSIIACALALGVAACGGGDEGPRASAGIVTVASVDGTDVLADSAGRTLYTAGAEKGGRVLCVDACASAWAPLLASSAEAEKAGAELDVKLGVVRRPDGEQQLTFDGSPLYTFAEEDAGELEGDGFVDDFQGTRFEWEAARASGGSRSSETSRGGGYGY